MSEWFPNLIHWQRDALNGHYPSSVFYANARTAENHITGYRDRCVYNNAWSLGLTPTGSGSTLTHRFRFRSRHGAKYLRLVLMLLPVDPGGASIFPTVDVAITEVGIGTITKSFSCSLDDAGTSDDRPSGMRAAIATIALTANAEHTGTLVLNGHARIASCMFIEVGDPTISESTDYYNSLVPAAGTRIFDTLHSRLLIGLSNMYRHNGGTILHWTNDDGSATTRSSATYINLIDNATAGAPTAATPGWYLDMSYRCTHSRPTSVPFEIAVYGSISAGSGTVKLVNSAGTTIATVTVNNATPGWFTATGTMSTTAGKFDLQYAGDGTHTLNVNAVSFQEYEA